MAEEPGTLFVASRNNLRHCRLRPAIFSRQMPDQVGHDAEDRLGMPEVMREIVPSVRVL